LTKPGRIEGSNPDFPKNWALWFTDRASISVDDTIVFLTAKLEHEEDDLWWFNYCGPRDFVLAMASSPSPDITVGDEYRLCLLVHPTSLNRSWQLKDDTDATELCFRVGHGYDLMTVLRVDGDPTVDISWQRRRTYYQLRQAEHAVRQMTYAQHGYISTTWCRQFRAQKYTVYEITGTGVFEAHIGKFHPANLHRELTEADVLDTGHNTFTSLQHRSCASKAPSIAKLGLGAAVSARDGEGRPLMLWTEDHGEEYTKDKREGKWVEPRNLLIFICPVAVAFELTEGRERIEMG
jgi:hypothetical protein